jgi:EAL domain-containing protein (putative c-di-GMP-specific phosphodiesterase class I)
VLTGGGYRTCECEEVADITTAIDAAVDLIVFVVGPDEADITSLFKALAAKNFQGTVLPFATDPTSLARGIEGLPTNPGMMTLPIRLLPADAETIRSLVRIALMGKRTVTDRDTRTSSNGCPLELWYEPKIHAREISLSGANALVCREHETSTAFQSRAAGPREDALLEAVVGRAIADWHDFFRDCSQLEVSLKLPLASLRKTNTIDRLCTRLPRDPSFAGLIVEIDSDDVADDLGGAKTLAKRLRSHKVAIGVDNVGPNWPSLAGVQEFPFVEIKVDRAITDGCATDTMKQSLCRQILDVANGYGARTVAQGIQSWDDFLMARDMGFDAVQGLLFSVPMRAQDLIQTAWSSRLRSQ